MKKQLFLAIAVVLLLGVMPALAAGDPIEVEIDIKPAKEDNPIGLNSRGRVPVAVLTDDGFDARDIDPYTVDFAGASPIDWTKKDIDDDGDKDMLFFFVPRDLVALDKNSTEATLTGETYDGVSFTGTDMVTIRSN